MMGQVLKSKIEGLEGFWYGQIPRWLPTVSGVQCTVKNAKGTADITDVFLMRPATE